MTDAWGLGEAFGYYMAGWESIIVARMLHPYRFIGIGSIALSPNSIALFPKKVDRAIE
ncbi:MAG: hypothetical protein HC789_18545 [Microcoleus sp. CSU_2_2]|nr:hypothetical protein [Microcoleus sp. CSU_2_2]